MTLLIPEPPEGGLLEIRFPMAPVSLQASSSRKAMVRAAFVSHLPRFGFLLSGDVAVEIEWMVQERKRYESSTSPDIDNIIKTFLDTLCGPDGVLINDAQVQSVSCCWIDWGRDDEELLLRLRYLYDDHLDKEDLIFVEIENGLCYPFKRCLPRAALRDLLSMLETSRHGVMRY